MSEKLGFTLVEILVSVVILSFIVGGIYAVFYVGEITWQRDMGLLDLQQGARQAIDGMVREIRQSRSEQPLRTLSVTPDGTKIKFYIPDYTDAISYYLSSNQIIREHPVNTEKVLANNISSLSFCCLGGSSCSDCSGSCAVQIQLGATKTVKQGLLSFSLSGKVKIRNE